MGEGTSRMNCPECGLPIQRKNLGKHYNRRHPGRDPYRRLHEERMDRSRKRLDATPGPEPLKIAMLSALSILLVVGGGIMGYFLVRDILRDGDSVLDPHDHFYSASDGAVINCTWYPSGEEGAPTVYLVHDIGEDRTVWEDFAPRLQELGYNAISIDLRGHGESHLNIKTDEIMYDWRTMTGNEMRAGFPLDFQGAYRWVHGNGRDVTEAGEYGALLGIGQGGLFGFYQSGLMSREDIMSATLLSPMPEAYGLDVPQTAENWGGVRPLMIAGGTGDDNVINIMDEFESRRPEDNNTYVRIPGLTRGLDLMDDESVFEAFLDTLERGYEVYLKYSD